MMAYGDDEIVMAAEYALGTLDADERAQGQAMMSVDPEFRSLVEFWEARLGTLNQMVGSIEPRPEVWERIRDAVRELMPQVAMQLPKSVDDPEAERIALSPSPVHVAQDVSRDNVIAFDTAAAAAGVARWRRIAFVTSAIAAALVAALSVQALRPELMPWAARITPPPRQVAQTAPPPAAPVVSAQSVALLQNDANVPGFVMTVDAATKNFTVRRLGDAPDAGKSYELWIVSDRLQRPRSLGVVGARDFTRSPMLASYDTDMVNRATYAVTLEPDGGSPTGVATGPIVFKGKLIETVQAVTPTVQ